MNNNLFLFVGLRLVVRLVTFAVFFLGSNLAVLIC